jgi:hypothetical protein
MEPWGRKQKAPLQDKDFGTQVNSGATTEIVNTCKEAHAGQQSHSKHPVNNKIRQNSNCFKLLIKK